MNKNYGPFCLALRELRSSGEYPEQRESYWVILPSHVKQMNRTDSASRHGSTQGLSPGVLSVCS